ncbi:MAG: methylenetetrahydrofolate reductase [NAD(P)H] [Proteobacteria bacterium]|jgi:methylenetetrahydrofolate reductase (NADPH)|nr:methylenetetrahydrofolate reductase [NAD(P)H] [Pseudomonadota bacterium]
MTKVVDHIKNSSSALFSFEILPPHAGESINMLFDNIAPLMEFKPKFIDVTYHREEFVLKKRAGGLLEQKSIRKRPGTVAICAALMHKFHVDTVPHIICGGFTKEETEYALIDLNYLGIDNVLALRGDSIKGQSDFSASQGGHAFASELVEQIQAMNHGRYIDADLENAIPTNFCIGVAGYPEKHFEAANLTTDLKWLKHKVDCGAEYIVTQMFFDNSKFFSFVDKCREAGINIPIIPGLKPLTSKKQISMLASRFHIDIPEDLADAVAKARDDKEVRQIGVEWTINQSKELLTKKAPCLHFYSMGKSTAIRDIAEHLY